MFYIYIFFVEAPEKFLGRPRIESATLSNVLAHTHTLTTLAIPIALHLSPHSRNISISFVLLGKISNKSRVNQNWTNSQLKEGNPCNRSKKKLLLISHNRWTNGNPSSKSNRSSDVCKQGHNEFVYHSFRIPDFSPWFTSWSSLPLTDTFAVTSNSVYASAGVVVLCL